jgi:hypothetical protein
MGLGACIVIVGLLGFIDQYDFTKSNPWKNYMYQDQAHMIDASVDHGEWEAINWIRNNLKGDVLILSDRQDIRHSINTITLSRFFAYSALSGKRFFMEGDDFTSGQTTIRKKRKTDIERIYNTENLELIDYAKSHEIDYAIFSKRFRNFNRSLVNHIIYENSSIIIVKT